MRIDEPTEEVLNFCDGMHTREEILQTFSEMSGEPVEEIAEGFDEFIAYMVDEGVMEWTESPSYIEPIYRQNRPFSITLDITSMCTLKCAFCSSNSGTPRPDDLTFDDIVHFVEQAKKYRPTPLAISGGEPLLKKELVLYMLEELSPIKEIKMTVFTNGTLITKDCAQQLYDAGLRFARVSIDGHIEQVHDSIRGKGTFKKTVQGITHLRELGIHVNTVSVISKINYPYLHEIRHFVIHTGDSFNLVAIQNYGRAVGSDLFLSKEERFNVNMANFLSERIQTNVSPRIRCHTGETIYIAANGDIFPCFYLQYPEFKVGNIRENDLATIYRTDIMQHFLGMTVNDLEGCRDCEIRYHCGGGCRGFAYSECGSLYVPDPLNCEKNKVVARRILENGEDNTRQLLQELLRATSELEQHQ